MRLNRAGRIANHELQRLGQRFPNVQLEKFIVMPNHVHGIIIIRAGEVGAIRPSLVGTPLQVGRTARPNSPAPGSLGAIIGQFKSRVTKRLWNQAGSPGTPVWQCNYYEHIIRDYDEHNCIYQYIESNPVNWMDDEENPLRKR